MRQLAILHVALEDRDGGAGRQEIALVGGLVRRGHRVLSVVRRGTPIERRAVAASAPVFALEPRFPRGPGGLLTWWSRRRLGALAAGGRWDLIHCADARSYARTASILRSAAGESLPLLVTCRGSSAGASASAPAPLRLLLRRGGRIHAASEAIWSALVRQGVDEDRLTVIHPGIPLERHDSAAREAARAELGLLPGDEAIGTVAILDRPRGVEQLIEAVASLRSTRPAARLVVVGDGPRAGALRERAARRDPDGGTIFAGWREDVPRLLPALEVYVFPGGGQEVFPLSLIEAMASGLPVVVSDQPGIREIIENGRQGLFVPEAGAESMARTILRALSDPAASREMGKAGAVRVQRFSTRAMIDATEKLYYRMARDGEPQ